MPTSDCLSCLQKQNTTHSKSGTRPSCLSADNVCVLLLLLLAEMPRPVATGLSSWRSRNRNGPGKSGTAADAVYNSMWWFRGEREMRHTEAGKFKRGYLYDYPV